jgi:hypothetical protein
MDAQPWQCPQRRTWIAPHVSEHRCPGEGSAGMPAPVITGGGGGGSTSAYIWPTGTSTATFPAGTTIITKAAG